MYNMYVSNNYACIVVQGLEYVYSYVYSNIHILGMPYHKKKWKGLRSQMQENKQVPVYKYIVIDKEDSS